VSRSNQGRRLAQNLSRYRDFGIGGIVVAVALAFGTVNPLFFRPENVYAILLSVGILVVLALGQMLVIVARQIDLSVGSSLGAAAMVTAMVGREYPDTPTAVLILVAVIVGAVLGAFNGFLVVAAKIPAIIATLGTLAIFRGLVFVVSDNVQVNPSEITPGITDLARVTSFPIPPIVLIGILVLVAGWFFTRKTMTGLRLFAVGSNPEAAIARGLAPLKFQFWVFVVMGALAGLGGVLYIARYSTVNPADVGAGFELQVISAVVIGGTNIFGGSGSVVGVLMGVLLVGILANGLTVIGVSGFWQSAAYGAIIIIAVVVDTLVRRRLNSSFQRVRKEKEDG